MTLTRGDGKGMPPPASSYPPPFRLSLFLAHNARQDTELALAPLLALKAKHVHCIQVTAKYQECTAKQNSIDPGLIFMKHH